VYPRAVTPTSSSSSTSFGTANSVRVTTPTAQTQPPAFATKSEPASEPTTTTSLPQLMKVGAKSQSIRFTVPAIAHIM
jgi:hypothetical protein